jgi:hypothetical protein
MPLDSMRLIERIRSRLRVPRYTGAWPGTLLRQSLERDPETIAMNGSDSLVTLSRTIIRKDAVYRQSDKGRSASVSGARLQQSSLRGEPEHIQKGALYLRPPCVGKGRNPRAEETAFDDADPFRSDNAGRGHPVRFGELHAPSDRQPNCGPSGASSAMVRPPRPRAREVESQTLSAF